MSWRSVDSQDELEELDSAVCWEDSSVVEYHAGRGPRPYYPQDINRSGHERLDLHILIEASASQGDFLELAFVQFEHHTSDLTHWQGLAGTVDSLRRVEIRFGGTGQLIAARLLYRWLDDAPIDGSFYRRQLSDDES